MMLICSDVHLREESADVVFGQVLPGILATCQERSIHHVVCLGDFWHLRYRVPVVLLNTTREWLQRFEQAGIEWTFLPGNHDQVDVRGRNALEVFDDMERVHVHSEPGWDKHGLWVPYRPNLAQIQAALELPRPKGAPPTCWLHYGVRGAMRNNHHQDTDGVEPGRFDCFVRVLCGHYHKQQDLGPGGKITYIGSPYQTRADEAGDPKGLAIWDGETLTRLNQAWGVKYVKGRLASVEDVDRMAVGDASDQHRLTLQAGVNLQQVAERLEARGITHYTLTPEPEPYTARLEVAESESVEAYARAYLESKEMDEGARSELWATFRRLTEGKHDYRKGA